jgi:hypothetical protein
LKLFFRDETELQQQLTIVKTCSNDLQMESGLHKYTTAVFTHGKLTKPKTFSLNSQTVLSNMELDKAKKYLGTEENEGNDNS